MQSIAISGHRPGKVAVAVFALLFGGAGAAHAQIVLLEPPRERIAAPARQPVLFLEEHRLESSIRDQVATTRIDQKYHNPNPYRVEGVFLFPVPRDTHIERLAIDVNGEMREAELLDAARARQIYEDIVRRSRDPALLEYAGQDLFRLRIFPIEPHAEKHLSIRFTQVLRRDGNLVEYVSGMDLGRLCPRPIGKMSARIDIESSDPITTVYSPTHAIELRRDGERKVTAAFEENGVAASVPLRLFYATRPARAGVSISLLTQEHDGTGHFMLLASPGEVRPDTVIAKDVVFVFDTSGSMSAGKMEQAKKALAYALDSLNPGDRFELIRFSTETEPLFGKLTAADAANRSRARQFVERLKPIGGTALEEALLAATSTLAAAADGARPRLVVFLTDGIPTIGNTDEEAIVRNVAAGARGARVFCFGIGTDVNTHLLDKVTEQTRAYSQYVLPEEDIEVKVSSLIAKLSNPVLADPQLAIDGPVRIGAVYPKDLPDLFSGDHLLVFGTFEGSGTARVRLKGTVNGAAQSFDAQADFRLGHSGHSFVPRLWAARRIGYLLDEIRLHGDAKELRDEVVALARKYGIVTPYTAYLIVEDGSVAERDRFLAVPRAAAPAERQRLAREFSLGQAAKSGDRSVAAARSNAELKRAEKSYAPQLAEREAVRGGESGGTLNRSRQAGGRTFYWNGREWIDAAVEKHGSATRVRVRFNSAEYFSLLAKHPEANAFFAVGPNPHLVLGDTVYEIFDQEGS